MGILVNFYRIRSAESQVFLVGSSGLRDTRLDVSFLLSISLIVVIILTLTAAFLCCYHWTRVVKRGGFGEELEGAAQAGSEAPFSYAVDRAASGAVLANHRPADAPAIEFVIEIRSFDPDQQAAWCKQAEQLPCPPMVYMPGDDLPTFIANPCAAPQMPSPQLHHVALVDQPTKAGADQHM